jgi:hypothetical protein
VFLEFTLHDLPGWVEVTLESNQDPEALGCAPAARDFPVCTATVTYRGRGYMAALGWIQLVRSTDGASGGTQFELDPFEPFGRLAHPFCWFGFAPTLFDAPSRAPRASLDWTAQSFLCFIAPVERGLEARAILGFSWGFAIRDEIVSLDDPSILTPAEWDAHLALLRREHPTWNFAAGFRSR